MICMLNPLNWKQQISRPLLLHPSSRLHRGGLWRGGAATSPSASSSHLSSFLTVLAVSPLFFTPQLRFSLFSGKPRRPATPNGKFWHFLLFFKPFFFSTSFSYFPSLLMFCSAYKFEWPFSGDVRRRRFRRENGGARWKSSTQGHLWFR